MIIFRSNRFLMGIAIGMFLCFGIMLVKQDENSFEEQRERLSIPLPPAEDIHKVRAYNFETGGYHYYSDQDIRDIREEMSYDTEGRYLYTPGRHVPSFEQMIDDYVEDNLDDLMDKHLD